MRYLTSFTLLVLLITVVSSCRYTDKSKRNVEYAPNMFYSIPLEALTQGERNTVFKDGLNSQKPPEGTVPRESSWYIEEAYIPYPYENTFEGYEAAGLEWTSPLDDPAFNAEDINCTEETYESGKRLYTTYCIMCHGPNGQGKGNLVTSGKFGVVPSYSDAAHRDLPVGKMYHSITYGKGIMGSYASQLTPKERWEVICYIQEFQKQPLQ